MGKKRVLITGGQVYGPLDPNKIVSGRARGLWAGRFAEYLDERGHEVTLLMPDTQASWSQIEAQFGARFKAILQQDHAHLVTHRGYWDYIDKCLTMATDHDVAVMAAAVVNWIPAEPYEGKMPTKGYQEGDVIQVPFVLAPRVIRKMKAANPKLTLVGCKMLVGVPEDELVEVAYSDVLLASRCNVVVANDMKAGLRRKLLVYPDRTVVPYDDDFDGFFRALLGVVEDVHYRTVASADTLGGPADVVGPAVAEARATMTRVVEAYRARFTPRTDDRVFGSVAVPLRCGGYLASPREKGAAFDGADGVLIGGIDRHTVQVVGGKATLNAPLLVRMLNAFSQAVAVLHLHEQLPGVPTEPYAPPGTVRDNERGIPGPAFNIEGHGFVACLDENLEITC